MENKNTGLIVLATILAIAVLGLGGFIVYDKVLSNNDTNTSEDNKENNTVPGENTTLDENTALNVVQNVYDSAMDFYTFDALDNCTWKTDNDDCVDLSEFWSKNPKGGYIKITNYSEVTNNIFTENGLEQFEAFMKNDLTTTPFIKEENGHTYVNAPTSGFYTGYATRNLKVTNISENEIKATIDVVDAFAESEGSSNAIKTKNIIIKKENNKWLMEEFAIPMHY